MLAIFDRAARWPVLSSQLMTCHSGTHRGEVTVEHIGQVDPDFGVHLPRRAKRHCLSNFSFWRNAAQSDITAKIVTGAPFGGSMLRTFFKAGDRDRDRVRPRPPRPRERERDRR